MIARISLCVLIVMCLDYSCAVQDNAPSTDNSPRVHKAADASYGAVSAAVAAAGSGDTVIVPEGSATWSNNLVITKGIYLIGAGIGKTVITSNYTNTGDRFSSISYLIAYNPSSPELNEPFRLSGFTIDCANKCRPVLLKNDNLKFVNKIRIDHLRILGGYSADCMEVKGHIFGVADSNIFDGCYLSVDFMDDTTWNNYTFDFGTANAFYFEDNTMVGRGEFCIIRSEMGAMWVSRYNTYDATQCTTGLYPWHDAHGNRGSAHHSVMGVEIYENTLTHHMPSESADIFNQRGGKGLCFNNKAYNIDAFGPRMDEEEPDSDNPPANNPISGQPQHISDSYCWGNRLNDTVRITASVGSTINYGGSIGVVPRENVHFWQENPSFNGTTGAGVGPLANRPVTCTVGVAYWATDTKILYRCTATNVWTEYYRPYTYPHPLRSLL